MALQQIFWEQIATEDITSGQTVNLGNPTSSLANVYADNFFINGTQSLNDLIGGGITEGIDPLNQFSASVLTSLEFTGSNLTVQGDLNVLGTFTSIKSETVVLDDNIIELNGSEESFGGLLIKDPTQPNLVSGSLLWDTTNDRWVGGPLGSEENLVIESELTTLSSSLSSSINDLSQSVSTSFDEVNNNITDLSSSLSSSINELSQSVDVTFTSHDGRLVDLEDFSSSLDATFATDQQLTDLSSSLSGSISELSSSLSSSINDLSQSVSSSFDQVNNDLSDLSSSLSSSINELSSSVDSTFTLHDGRLVELESTGSNHETRIDDLELFSSSLDSTFATDQELTNLSQSITSSIGDIETSLSSLIDTEKGRIDAILTGSDADKDSFKEIVDLINSVDLENDESFASYYTSSNNRFNSLETTSGSHDGRISDLETFSSSLDNTYATDQELEDISASLSDAIGNAQTDIEASNIFQQTGSYYGTSENLQISGSGLDSPDGSIAGKYGVIVSKSLHAENINVGQPTSNEWGTMNGSYFNNFNENTDVSEIIRFMAGLLSSSAPDASPNTKYYNGYTKNTFNTSTDSGINGYLPSGTTNTTLIELIDAGFASIGGTILGSFGTFYTNSNYRHSFTSRYGGSTTVRSSNDGNLFGLGRLSSGTPTTFKVSGSFTFKKFDHNRVLLEESSSNHLIQQSGAGTTNGVTLGKIESANPELIPAGYQDGKYSGVFSPTILNAGNTIDDIGYYHISSSISIASGSSDFTTPIENNTEILYGPIPTIESGIGSTNLGVTATIDSMTQLTATSRSLSGAPYLQTATFNASGSIGGTFNKLYQNGTHGSMSGNSGQRTASVSGGRISTSNVFYDETFTDIRSSGTIPFITDKIKLNSGLSWSAGNSYGTSANQSVSISGTGFGGSRSDSESRSVHIAGSFGQPSASGSLHYYGRSQTYDGSSNTSENFTGEGRRLQLNDNLLSFGGSSWDNTYNEYGILGSQDLQVRPNRLVKPGGNNGYWLTNPSNSSDYKYYVRKFSTSGTKTSMSINVSGPSLVSWDSTNNNSASVAILFESSTTNVYSNARFYDPTKTLENFVGSISPNTDGTNPFGSDIDLYGNTGGSGSGGSYSLPMRNSDGMFLNSTYNEIIVLVRYKGDPTPITGISVSFS